MAGRGRVLELSSHLLEGHGQDTSLLWASYQGACVSGEGGVLNKILGHSLPERSRR